MASPTPLDAASRSSACRSTPLRPITRIARRARIDSTGTGWNPACTRLNTTPVAGLSMRPPPTSAIIVVLVAGLACGRDPTSVPRKLTGVWTGLLSNAPSQDSVRVVIAQYSDFLQGDAVFASAAAARYAVVGSFISSDVELDFIRLPAFTPNPEPEFRFRGTYSNGRISGQVTGTARDGSIALVRWRPNVGGIPGTYVLVTLNGAPVTSVSPGVHDTLLLGNDGQLTRARSTPSLSYEIPGIYERKASSVIVRYLSPFFDYAIPERDSLVVRGSALVRNTSTFSGSVEEAYQRVP
ncbi:MAG: hypothetical protein ACJ77T_03795 [Gemmatimonadaceae bacterium]